MWAIGLLIGAAIGGAYGAAWVPAFAVLGAIAGLLVGLRLKSEREAAQRRYADLDAKARYLYDRLVKLEQRPVDAPKPAPGEVPSLPAAAETPDAFPPEMAESPARPEEAPALSAPGVSIASPVAPDEVPQGWLARVVFSGNILAKIGVVLLFFGVGSALKLAAEYGVLPIEARLGIAALVGVAMAGVGWRKRASHRMFALALQGGGVGVLYLVGYFALARYQLIGHETAFALFALLGVGCMVLAALQDGRSLAVLGLTGAFLAPVLASSPAGSHIALFSYFALLNGFIVAVSWFKSWRSLNVAGFLLTFAIGFNWGLKFYRPEHFATTEAFLVLFFLIYSLIPLLFALRPRESTADARLDGALVFGTPLVCGLLQVPLVEAFEYGLAWSFAIAGTYYGLLGTLLLRMKRTDLALTAEAQFWLCAALLTLAVPFAFGARATVTLWTLAGAAAVWLAMRRERPRVASAGCALQILAAVHFALHWGELSRAVALANDVFVGGMLIAVSAFLSSAALARSRKSNPSPSLPSAALLLWAWLWYVGTGFGEIDTFLARSERLAADLAFLAASLWAAEWGGRRLGWRALRLSAAALPLVLALAAFAAVDTQRHPFAHYGGVAWPLAFAAHFAALFMQERDGLARWLPARHALGFWVLAGLAGWEASWQMHELAPEVRLWRALAWGIVPAALVQTALALNKNGQWPAAKQRTAYLGVGSGLIALALGLWSLGVNLEYSGAAGGWPYLPLINPLDLAQGFVLVTLLLWAREQGSLHGLLRVGIGGLGFVWISALAARVVHHWLGVPFRWRMLFDSVALQASWSLLWTTLAIGLMIHATRSRRRAQWFAGFDLLGLVGLKLLLVDTAHVNTLGRTVSLLGVALLVIAASYFAPTPPRDEPGGVAGPA